MTRRFTVHIDLPDTLRTYYLDVVVHDTDAEMVRLARRKHGPGMPDDIGGCVHSDFTNPRRVGLMRLSAEHLNGSFIIHESVHAGVTQPRRTGCLRVPQLRNRDPAPPA